MTEDLEQRFLALERAVRELQIQLGTRNDRERARAAWIRENLTERGCISWGAFKDDLEFARRFPFNATFHQTMARVQDIFAFKVLARTVDNEKFYYREGFDIGPVVQRHEWNNSRADDTKLLDQIIRKAVLKSPVGNIDRYIADTFPTRGERWQTDLANNLILHSKKHYLIAWKGANWAHELAKVPAPEHTPTPPALGKNVVFSPSTLAPELNNSKLTSRRRSDDDGK